MKFRRLGTIGVALSAALWLWLAVAGAADQTEGVLIYVSSTSDGTVDGIDFKDEDILVYNSETDAWAMYFDGSDVGLNGSDINAMHILDDNNDTTLDPILMSVKNQFLPDIGAMVDDSDVLRFTPTSLGSNTAGTFTVELDGSDVGLTTNNEEIDALTVRADGRLVVSTSGSFRVPATGGGDLRGQGHDLISLATSGTTWEWYFDGSDVGLTKSTENVWGAWIDARTGDLYLTTKDEFSVPGSPINPLTGDQEDIILFTGAKGETTNGTFSDFWDGDTHRFAGQRLDGMSMAFLNAAPDARDDAFTTDEDTPLVGEDLFADNGDGADSDPDGDPFAISQVNGSPGNVGGAFALPSGAQLLVTSTGSMDYDPTGALDVLDEGDSVDDTFTYTIEDIPIGASDTATVTVTVTGVNDPPIAQDDSDSTDEDTGISTDVLANDTDVDGDDNPSNFSLDSIDSVVVAGLTTDPNLTTGSVTIVANQVAFDPGTDFDELQAGDSATVSVGYTMSDDSSASSSATLVITVSGTDDAPVAVNDAATVTEDDPATAIDVLGNDTDVDGGPKLIGSASDPAGGTVVVTGGGTGLTYAPDPDFCNDGTPTDDFTYTLNGGSTATVSVTVTCVNDAPVVTPSGATSSFRTGDPAVIVDGGIAVSDVDDPTLASATVTIANLQDSGDEFLAATASGGIATGDITYSEPTLTINPAGGAPLADFQAVLQSVTYHNTANPVAGSPRTIEFVVNDGLANSNTAQVTVNVVDNEAPVIVSNGGGDTASVNAAENQTAVTDVNASDDADSEGSGLTYSLTGGADQAFFSIDLNTGVVTFDAAPDFENPVDFDGNNDYEVQVTVSDSGGLTDSQDITVTVTDVNDAPVIISDGGGPTAAVNAAENQTAVTDVDSTDQDGDTEGSGLTYSLTGGADQGAFSINLNTGVVTFNAAPDFETPGDSGGDNDYEVQVTVTDSGGLTDVQTVTVTVTDANDAPTANDEAYDAIGNVGITVAAGSGVLANDVDEDSGDTVGSDVLVSAFDATSLGGGDVNVAGDGSFTYDPAPGFTGVDTFGYTIQDSGGLQDSATVTITVSTPIWFIDVSAAVPGDGRLASPFQGLVGAGNSFDANAADDPGDFIFLADGSYTGGLTLLDNQELIGDGSSSDLATILGITVPPHSNALPTFNGIDPQVGGSSGGITLGAGNTVRGLDIVASGGTGLGGSAVGTLTVSEVDTISISGARAIDLQGGSSALSVTVDSVTATTSASGGVRLANNGGTTTLGDVTIATSGGTGFHASNAGTLNVNSGGAGTATITSDGGRGLELSGTTVSITFDSVDVGSTIASPFGGASLSSLTGTVNIADLDVTTSAGTGLFASAAGTLNVSTGTISSPGSRAVDIDTTALGVSLESVSSVGGSVPGIDLSSTSGSFTVTGTGSAGSGGTISNKTGNVDGVIFSTAPSVSLSWMNISNNSRNGVFGTNVNGFTLAHSVVNANADQVTPDEAGVLLSGLAGTINLTNTTVSNSHEHNAKLESTAGTATINVSGSTFGPNPAGSGAQGLLVDTEGTANVTLNVSGGSSFTGNQSNGIFADTAGGTLDVTVQGSTFSNNNVGIGVSASNTGTLTFDIANNPSITGNRAVGVRVFTNASHTSTAVGTISGNTVGTSGTLASGSLLGSGISAANEGSGTMTLLIDNNTVQEVGDGTFTGFEGIFVIGSVNAGTTNATVTNNVIDQIRDDRGIQVRATADTVCADIQGNTLTNIGHPTSDIRVSQSATGVMNVRQTSTANISAVNGGASASDGGTVNYNQGACTLPPP